MSTNVGLIDRIVRVVAGILLVVLALEGRIGAWGWVGLVPLVTGLVGLCPLYGALGWSTRAR